MSRIGKKPITVPAGVEITLDPKACRIAVKGAKGQLEYEYRPEVDVRWEADERSVVCSIPEAAMAQGQMRAYWGTVRSRIQNMITGVTEGYSRKLDIIGVGWNGYCHPVDLVPADGVEFAVEANRVTISGPDKQAVGQFAAVVRSKRPPEPYNGKGIKYMDEIIIRKQGKVFGS